MGRLCQPFARFIDTEAEVDEDLSDDDEAELDNDYDRYGHQCSIACFLLTPP